MNRAYPLHLVLDTVVRPTEVAYLINSDVNMLESLSRVLTVFGIRSVSFTSVADYLLHSRVDLAACMVVDVELPDFHLLRLEAQSGGKTNPPFVVLGSRWDVPSAVQAMKAGAIELLATPIDADALSKSVRTAFEQDRKLRHKKAELATLQTRFSRLTPREREVYSLVAGGLLNKQTAVYLGISDVTVQIHRGQVMKKMEAKSFADLVRFAVKLRMPYWREAAPATEQRLLA